MRLGPRPVDPEAVTGVPELLAAEGVGTRPPPPTLAEWVAAIGELLRDRLLSGLGWMPESGVVEALLWTLLAVGAGLLVAFGVASVRQRRRAPPAASTAPGAPLPEAGDRLSADAAAWRRRLHEALRRGDRRAALEASWSWLLTSLAGDATDVRPLAGRRLARERGRLELMPLVRRLEAASYAGEAPDLERLHELERQLEAALGAGR